MYIVVTFTVKKKNKNKNQQQNPKQTLPANVFGAQGFLLMWIVCNLFYVVYANLDTLIDT